MRERVAFWLDTAKDDEREIAHTITQLKRRRMFSAAIRDGLRLVADLRGGRLDVLIELFPWVVERLTALAPQRDDELKEQIARLEAAIRQQRSGAPSPDAPMMKKLSAPKIELPRFDDEDDDATLITVTKHETTEEDLAIVSRNFMASFDFIMEN